jgi:ABC-2 type transport system ATP-binding protein
MGQRNQLLWELPAMDTFKLNQAIYEISDKRFKQTVGELSDLLDADEFIGQPVKTLSLGQRMKMELIAALLHRPKVLFLDEPTIGLDVIAQKTIRDFIQEYQARYNATILLTSHYMEDVRRLAKRVIIIDHGKIIYSGAFGELLHTYANEKRVEIMVDDMPRAEDLKKIPFKAQVSFPKVSFKAHRKDLPHLVQLITEHISFVDMTIEEEKIEDVVRKIFMKSST